MTSIVRRKEALRHCRFIDETNYRVLIIQAQPGQGKTFLAHQYAEETAAKSVFCTCSDIDRDPEVFFEHVLNALEEVLEYGAAEGIRESIINSNLSPQEIPKASLTQLRRGLKNQSREVRLLLDDTHELLGADLSLEFLAGLPDALPFSFKIIVISRYPLFLNGQKLFPNSSCLFIDNCILAFTIDEIRQLYFNNMSKCLTYDKAESLLTKTEGWIAGLVLLQGVNHFCNQALPGNINSLSKYFALYIIEKEEQSTIRSLLKLSLLEYIPNSLPYLQNRKHINDWLQSMVDSCFFIRREHERGQTVFRMHQLLRDYLRRECMQKVSKEDQSCFLKDASMWHLDNNDIEMSLMYLLKSSQWNDFSDILKNNWFKMAQSRRHVVIKDIIDSVPSEVVRNDPWLLFIKGVNNLSTDMQNADEPLHSALKIFRIRKDKIGETLCISQLMISCVLLSGTLMQLKHLVPRGICLYFETREQMESHEVLIAGYSLMSGYAYHYFNPNKIEELANYLNDVHQKSGITNSYFSSSLPIMEIYKGCMGDFQNSMNMLEKKYIASFDDSSSLFEKFCYTMMRYNWFSFKGDFINHKIYKSEIQNRFGHILESTYLKYFLIIWDIDVLFGQNRLDDAHKLIFSSLKNTDIEHIEHIHTQILQYAALAHALNGNRDSMKVCAKKSLKIRAKVGGEFFVILNQAVIGAAYILSNSQRNGVRILNTVIKKADQRQLWYVSITAHAYLAYSYIDSDLKKAKIHTNLFIERMKMHNNIHFQGWTQIVFEKVLNFAACNNIHFSYVKQLYLKRLNISIDDKGSSTQICEIKLFANRTIAVNDIYLQESDLSSIELRLLLILSENTNPTLSLDEIVGLAWPDDPERDRKKLDAALNRLRKRIDGAFGKGAGKTYIAIRNGRIGFQHCRVDFCEAVKQAKSGINLSLSGKPWQACDAFNRMAYWLGESFYKPRERQWFFDTSISTITDAVSCWASTLILGHRHRKAIDILSLMLQINPWEEKLHTTRYMLLLQVNDIVDAHKARQEYARMLFDLGLNQMDEEEIEERLTQIQLMS